MTDRAPTSERLAALVRAGEGQHVEFKSSLRQLGRALEALCGMLNANGGEAVVVFGVGPDGKVVGVDPANLESTRRGLVRAVANNVRPALRAEVAVVRLDGSALVTLSAARSPEVPLYECDGQAYIRVGSETLRMTPFERVALTARRGPAQAPRDAGSQ
jgi:predicted HTH transcriptional regulator